MVNQGAQSSAGGSGPPRSTKVAVSDTALVVIGLALIAGAFTNVPVQVSGLVNVKLHAPGVLLVPIVFGIVGFALLLLSMGRLFDGPGRLSAAWAWWKRRQEPRPRHQPGLDVGIPPPRDPLFRGRERELGELAQRLAKERRVDLSGLGGAGKTSLAIEYLHRQRADYLDGVFWLRGQNEATLVGDYADLACLERLNLDERRAPDLEQVTHAVTRWLLANPHWLLVVDDLDAEQIPTLDRLLARGMQGHVLVTCRVPVWNHPVEIGPLASEVAIDYLLERTEQDDRPSATAVAEMLDCLPLALEQAAAYMHDTGRSLASYAGLARTRLGELMREGRRRDYPDPVATTWSLSFGRIEQASPAAAAVLRICACLAPDSIPVNLLKRSATELPGDLGLTLGDDIGLDLAIRTLRRYAMVPRQGETLRMHSVVQAAVRDLRTHNEWTAVVLRTLRYIFPADVRDPTNWPDCAALAPHLQVVMTTVGSDMTLEPAVVSWLFDRLGTYLLARGEFKPARSLLERALKLDERVLGPDHPDTATSLNNLAMLLVAQGELTVARWVWRAWAGLRERAAVGLPNDSGRSGSHMAESPATTRRSFFASAGLSASQRRVL